MKHTNSRRSRGRNGKKGPSRMQVFDSNGPDVRIRGTAYQVTEKYMALAKDASASGDHTLAQNYLQHAEHYQRIINAFNADSEQKQAAKDLKEAENGDSQEDFGLVDGAVVQQAAKQEKQQELETS